jgi:hypothetical protein
LSLLEKIVLLLTFFAVIAIGGYVVFGPDDDAGNLEKRVSALEGRLQNADGNDIDLKQYVKWADSVTQWTDDTGPWVKLFADWIKDGTISCTKACPPIEGESPPGGGTCKPGQC